MFGKHSLGRSILGTPQSLEKIGRAEILEFTKRHYQPSISVLAAVGQESPAKALELAEKYFGSWQDAGVSLSRRKPKVRRDAHVVKNRDAHQAHLAIGGEALSWYHPDNRTLALIMNYLGGPSLNSRLSYILREKHGIGYHAEANYQPYSDCGYFSFYVGTDRKNVDRCRKIIESEIRDLHNGKLKGNLLREVKRQMKGQIVMARESGGAVVNYLAKSALIHGYVETPEEIFRELDAITEKDIARVSRLVFRPEEFNSIEFY
jgi:predicted Zn-dependent peptidase